MDDTTSKTGSMGKKSDNDVVMKPPLASPGKKNDEDGMMKPPQGVTSPGPEPLSNDDGDPLPAPLHKTRSLILRLTVLVGNLCALALQTFPLDPPSLGEREEEATYKSEEVRKAMARVFACLMDIAASLHINLHTAILKKMELNRLKYPVELCKVRRRRRLRFECPPAI